MRTTRLLIPFLAVGVALGGYAVASAASAPASTTSSGHHHAHAIWPFRCPPNADLTSLTVQRGDVLNPETFTFPATQTVTGPAVETLAHALCALPVFPTGARSCPNADGPTYTLTFSGARSVVAIAAPTGCQSVLLRRAHVTAHDDRVATDAFWALLGTTIGLTGATSATFAGSFIPTS